MFHEGDLQSGIALALQESKRVICFVSDDEEESKTWENEYLADEEISELIAQSSVTLRLAAGSQEVGFLSSFCPINKVPTLVVIRNGVLQEYIVSGTSQDQFKQRLKAVLSGGPRLWLNPQLQVQPEAEQNDPQQPASPDPAPTQQPNSSPNVADPPTEETAAEKFRRESIRAGKQRAQSPEPDDKQDEQQRRREWRAAQRKREQNEREERERIRGLIRHDNEERKAREERRRLGSMTPKEGAVEKVKSPAASNSASQFRIQVRLFDGSTIRSTFQPSQTVRGALRPWIDQQRGEGDDAPYTLKQILAPLPNKKIAVGEEDQTLQELGLGPTASLVMVPVQKYTEAYTSGSSLAPLRTLRTLYMWVWTVVGMIVGALWTFLGLGQSQTQRSGSQAPAPAAENGPRRPNAGGNSNIRTLHDSHADRGPHQFYNGNQLNFEPRKDEDGDKKKDD